MHKLATFQSPGFKVQFRWFSFSRDSEVYIAPRQDDLLPKHQCPCDHSWSLGVCNSHLHNTAQSYPFFFPRRSTEGFSLDELLFQLSRYLYELKFYKHHPHSMIQH